MSKPVTCGHGTRGCYGRGCRRPECRAANTAYVAARRARGLDRALLTVSESQPAPVVPLTRDQRDLVSDNMKLVYWAANRMRLGWIDDFDDVLSDATEGLVVAALRFDPDRGRFSTYAVMWIRYFVNRGRDRRLRERPGEVGEGIDLTTPEDLVVGRLDAIEELSA